MTTGSAGSALINRPSTGRWTNALVRGMKIGWKSKRQPSDSAIISAGRRAIRATLIDLHAPECANTHIQLCRLLRQYHNPPNNAGRQSMGPLSNSPSVCKCIATGWARLRANTVSLSPAPKGTRLFQSVFGVTPNNVIWQAKAEQRQMPVVAAGAPPRPNITLSCCLLK